MGKTFMVGKHFQPFVGDHILIVICFLYTALSVSAVRLAWFLDGDSRRDQLFREGLEFYRCFQALLHCEAPRGGSSVKSSSKPITRAMKGVAMAGPRQTNDYLFMVASLGQPAATVPQLGPSLEPTIDLTKPASSDNQPVVVVSLVAHFDG